MGLALAAGSCHFNLCKGRLASSIDFVIRVCAAKTLPLEPLTSYSSFSSALACFPADFALERVYLRSMTRRIAALSFLRMLKPSKDPLPAVILPVD